ncbi:MAG: 30S ribosomal protein S21 [Candidatus Cloacimonadota bacterium]|nr:MAG: 30S ribosomal protein S21 [Candidatus Cloacimonadota bacterium]
MVSVKVQKNESFDSAFRRFKKKCQRAGILSDIRKHSRYEKPSEKRKRLINAAIKKNRRQTRTYNIPYNK